MIRSALPVLAAVSLMTAAPAQAQTGPLGAMGLWKVDLAASHFNEALTGPAPLSAELDVTKDDGKSLAWTLIEEDESGLAAIQFADSEARRSCSSICRAEATNRLCMAVVCAMYSAVAAAVFSRSTASSVWCAAPMAATSRSTCWATGRHGWASR